MLELFAPLILDVLNRHRIERCLHIIGTQTYCVHIFFIAVVIIQDSITPDGDFGKPRFLENHLALLKMPVCPMTFFDDQVPTTKISGVTSVVGFEKILVYFFLSPEVIHTL